MFGKKRLEHPNSRENYTMTDQNYNHPHYLNIPYFILQDEKLDFFNKFLFSLFWSFSLSGKRITTSNGYLAALFKVSEKYIQMRIKELEDFGYIRRFQVKYNRCIEVLHVPFNAIECSDSAELKLVPTTVGVSTKIELPPTTVGAKTVQKLNCHQPQLGGGPTTVGTDIKEDKKDNTKHTARNDFFLETALFPDSEQQRKAIVMRELCLKDEKAKAKHAALKSDKTFEEVLDECVSHYGTQQKPQLVSPQRLQSWINRDSRFQTQQTANKPQTQYPTKEQRAVESKKIEAREIESDKRKSLKQQDAGVYKSIVNRVRFSEMAANQEADRIAKGMSLAEYHEKVIMAGLKNANAN